MVMVLAAKTPCGQMLNAPASIELFAFNRAQLFDVTFHRMEQAFMFKFSFLAGGLLVGYDQAAFGGKHLSAVVKVLSLMVSHFN